MPLPPRAEIDDFADLGVRAFTTTRAAGTFGLSGTEPVREVMGRWSALHDALRELGAARLASARQVHGARVVTHGGEWTGWLRVDDADGHVAPARGTALAVTVADCVPVFVAHPSGTIALLHAGWRGTAARVLQHGIAALATCGAPARELRIHLGPAICGQCYEVGPEVVAALTGRCATGTERIDLRHLLAEQARALGVQRVTASERCTRCDQERLFSHRGGDSGRQLGVMVALP